MRKYVKTNALLTLYGGVFFERANKIEKERRRFVADGQKYSVANFFDYCF